MSLVIVAIPRKDDPIWKISSEKVPHMTILFLGDGDNPKRGQIAQFLEHAAKTSMTRFSLDVDRRGEIGEDQADVLFFKDRWDIPRVRDFRAQLL
jgi:2'-5' RNA ligase